MQITCVGRSARPQVRAGVRDIMADPQRRLRDHAHDAASGDETRPGAERADRKNLTAGVCAANGANTPRWRFLVIKIGDQAARPGALQAPFDEVVGALSPSPPPPGGHEGAVSAAHAAVEYLTDHFHKRRWGSSPASRNLRRPPDVGRLDLSRRQNMLLAARAGGSVATLTTRHLLFEKEQRSGARAAARVQLVRDPPDRLSDGPVRPGRARAAFRDRVRGSLGQSLSSLMGGSGRPPSPPRSAPRRSRGGSAAAQV